ncbi:hypothetical protein MMC06_002350 [Schaereria dolodes]|nr:hypothetical protein [Schaereria dolodes]
MGTTQGVIHRLKPVFSEKEIPDQPSQIFIVTGGGTGYGSVIGQALDHLNGRVSISTGETCFFQLNLADLTTIEASVEEVLDRKI